MRENFYKPITFNNKVLTEYTIRKGNNKLVIIPFRDYVGNYNLTLNAKVYNGEKGRILSPATFGKKDPVDFIKCTLVSEATIQNEYIQMTETMRLRNRCLSLCYSLDLKEYYLLNTHTMFDLGQYQTHTTPIVVNVQGSESSFGCHSFVQLADMIILSLNYEKLQATTLNLHDFLIHSSEDTILEYINWEKHKYISFKIRTLLAEFKASYDKDRHILQELQYWYKREEDHLTNTFK